MNQVAMYAQGGFDPVVMNTTVLDTIADLSEAADYVKLTEAGFIYGGKVLPRFPARIINNKPYWVKWENKIPHKIDVVPGVAAPEGYDLKVDLTVAVNDMTLALSLSSTSAKFQYAPYVRFLKAQGLTPADVVTEIGYITKTGQSGSYQQATFKMLSTIQDAQQAKPSPVNVTPTAQPAPTQPTQVQPDDESTPSGW